MADQYKNAMIALFVLAATSIVVFILLFIHPSTGDERKELRVRFSDIDKVSPGTRVSFGGKPVGEVIEINEIQGENNYRESRNGKIYLYELVLKVDSAVNLFNSDEVSLRTSGLLGEKSVAIIPLPPRPGEKLRIVDDEIIYAQEVGSVEQTFKDFKEVADKVDVALDNLNRILEEFQREKTVKHLARTASNLADITESLNKPKELGEMIANLHEFTTHLNNSWPQIATVIDNINESSVNIRDITASVNQPDQLTAIVDNAHTLTDKAVASWDTVDIALNDIASTSSNAKQITTAVNKPDELSRIVDNFAASSISVRGVTDSIGAGKGTVGKLFMEEELYLRVTALLNKAEVVANDVNHYGLLFHLDKGWQRLRARRLNLMMKLCSPQEFRNYFNDEIDTITTSLERVNMVLDKNEELYPCGLLLENSEFAKVYAELLRRVEAMEESLKMYNQQVVDSALFTTELTDSCCETSCY